MIALFMLIIAVTTLGLSAAWIGRHPGMVTIQWQGYEIETSAGVLLILVLFTAIAVSMIYVILRNLLMAPKRFAERRSLKQLRLGLAEITHSVALLAASDVKQAQLHTRRAERHLGETPLTLLLKAQVSKTLGNDAQTKALLEKLLDHPQTEYVAAKSLADGEAKQKHIPQALMLAKRAHDLNPKLGDGAWTVFDLMVESGKLQEAETHAIQALKKKAFSRGDLTLARGKIAFKQALQTRQSGDKQATLRLLENALKAMPYHAEAGILAAQLYCETGQQNKAQSLILKQWKSNPSDTLAKLYLSTIKDEKPAKQAKLIDKLKATNPEARENIFL